MGALCGLSLGLENVDDFLICGLTVLFTSFTVLLVGLTVLFWQLVMGALFGLSFGLEDVEDAPNLHTRFDQDQVCVSVCERESVCVCV